MDEIKMQASFRNSRFCHFITYLMGYSDLQAERMHRFREESIIIYA